MQRRSFLKNAACVGASATVLAPIARAAAAGRNEPATRLRLERLPNSAEPTRIDGLLRVQATPVVLGALDETLRVRLWVASDAGPRAHDFATFARNGISQRLRFVVSPNALIGFEAASGQHLDDCSAQAACNAGLAGLGPGRYRLWLSRADVEVAAVDLQVEAHAA